MNMKTFYSTKKLNPNYYMEIGSDEGYAVLYVYKEGKLFDWHFSCNTSFASEMKNTIECYHTVHNIEPRIEDIACWRTWFKALKNKNIIN